MKYINSLLLLLCLIFLLPSCFDENFEEINTNPNAINEVSPNLLLTSVLFNSVEVLNLEAFIFTAEIMNQNLLDSRNPTDVALLNWRTRGPWANLYARIADVEEGLKRAEANGQKNYQASFKVLRAWLFSILTDLYGDIPYSVIINQKEPNLAPVYDLQQNIYLALLKELEDANALFDTKAEAIRGDIMYNGNITKWKKFCNSLRLRLLLRASNTTGFNAASQMAAIVSNPTTNPIFEVNDDNALLKYDGNNASFYSVSTLSNFIGYYGSELLVDTLVFLKDSRLNKFFDPSVNSIKAGSPKYKGWSFRTTNITADLSSTNDDFKARNLQNGIIMTYSELQFILAEAAQRGLISGNAKTFYDKGITTSFEYWKAALPANYLAQPEVTYNNTLGQIIFQKWIHGFTTPYETWFDWRRTGFPKVPVEPKAGLKQLPLRFGYPDTEATLNADSYNQAVQRIGKDDPLARMWLLK